MYQCCPNNCNQTFLDLHEIIHKPIRVTAGAKLKTVYEPKSIHETIFCGSGENKLMCV